ncbi:MAG TPA: SPFH domain-containing protein [Humisphaera sp.]
MILALMILVGGTMAVGAWLPMVELPIGSRVAVSTFGTLVLGVGAVCLVINRLYRKAAANMAFVRTGGRGARVIRDGGAIVIPVLHQVTPVSLETMRLNVERRGPHALITKDNLRVDLSAEFYIKVQPDVDNILQAARSLGSRNVQPDAVSELVQEKLVSALRTVAATKELVELHAKRDEFASSVQEIVQHDLSSNGLSLESVTISALDQTDPGALQERNVFDAQGLRKIAEITQKARIERNEIERESERQVAEKDVSTRKKVLELQRDQAEFEAEQKMKVANVNAARQREVAEFKITQDEAVAKRDIEKQRTVETTEVERRLAVEQAEIAKRIALIAKTKEQETADILKKQAVEVAERAKQVAVAEKERERAAALALVLAAEAEAEREKQKVVTVTVTSEAEREAQKKLIAAQQAVNENKIREETNADVLAYMAVKEAEGQRQAAELQYEAKLRVADADAQAAAKRADGERAARMVEVNVERERVNVEQARVEVERQSLANKSEFEAAALNFELEKMRIAMEREVRIAAAQAMANMFAKAQMQIFGDPATMAQMSGQFMRAASLGAAADGLLRTLPPGGQELLGKVLTGVAGTLTPAPGGVSADVQQPAGAAASPAVAAAPVEPSNGSATAKPRV